MSISVVLASYNGEKYLAEQIRSILTQSYQDFELIIVDDCSSDNSIKVIKEVSKDFHHINIKIIIHDGTKGVNEAFSTGIKIAAGDYIAFSDQDDIWLPNKLQQLHKTIIQGKYDVVYAPSFILENNTYTKKYYLNPKPTQNKFRKYLENKARGASILIKKEYLNTLIPFPVFDLYDKYIFFISLYLGKITFLNAPLDYYRIHISNIVGTNFKYRSKNNLIEKLKNSRDFYSYIDDKLASMPYQLRNKRSFLKYVEFYNDLLKQLTDRKLFVAIGVYFKYVLINGFSLKDNLTYFYYIFLK